MRSHSLVSLFSLVIGVGFYIGDVFLYHLSASLALTSYGVFATFWMLWVIHCLAELPYRQNILLIVGMTLVVWVHSVQSVMEVLLPLLVLWLWAMTYHSFFVISNLRQKRVFMIFSYGILLCLPHLKFALQMDSPWLYMWQHRWVTVWGINVILYLLLGERLFWNIQQRMKGVYAVHH